MDGLLLDWVLLPLLILIARIPETVLKTLRQVYAGKGLTYAAAASGVGEMTVWLLSTGLVLTHLTSIACILAYIGGYAIGTVVGMNLEQRIKVGNVMVRIIARDDADTVVTELREQGFGVTRVDGSGCCGSRVAVLFTIVPRSALPDLLETLTTCHPRDIFAIEDVRTVKEGVHLYHKPKQRGILAWFQR